MSERNTVVRSLHDLGLAAWFGGALMGVIGINGAASKATSPTERLRLSSIGWARWAPVQWAAIVAHGIGSVALIFSNAERLAVQPEGRTSAVVKFWVTIFAGVVTLYSALVGIRMGKHADEGATGVTEPGPTTSPKLASAQRQQKVLQWLIPASTSVLIVLAAQQGEQQRPVAGLAKSKAKGLKRR